MTTSNEDSGPIIPDFEKDAQSLAAYAEARQRFERREANDAESRTRTAFAKKREAIRAEIAVALSVLEDRRAKAQKALADYAARYPHRVERNRPVRPSFWDTLLSFGNAGKMYRRTVETVADVSGAQALRRRKESDEEELEQQLKRALQLQGEAIKKRLASQEGTDAFHARPGVAALYARVEEINAERTAYAARLESGGVTPLEQRDREFAERTIAPGEPPFNGAAIVRVVRYGDFTYFLLRDLERNMSFLPYDPRLEPLIESVFDVYRIADSFEARATRGRDGRPLPVLGHYLATYPDPEVARSEFRKARTALRVPRAGLPPMTSVDPVQQRVLDVLAGFARTLGPATVAAHLAAAATPNEADSVADADDG